MVASPEHPELMLEEKKCLKRCGLIGERSEPLSDKLGGEICIAMRVLVCIYLYIQVKKKAFKINAKLRM